MIKKFNQFISEDAYSTLGNIKGMGAVRSPGFCSGITEDAMSTLGNTGGMGAVVAPQVSAIPGDVAGGVKGSGDIACVLGGNSSKIGANGFNPMEKKKKKKKNKIYKYYDFQKSKK